MWGFQILLVVLLLNIIEHQQNQESYSIYCRVQSHNQTSFLAKTNQLIITLDRYPTKQMGWE